MAVGGDGAFVRTRPEWMGLVLSVLVGCWPGAKSAGPSGVATGPTAARVAGAEVVALRRPTDGLVALTLYVDAGSRDSDPPSLATVAAEVAARRAGATARVFPDGTELRLECATTELPRCIDALGEALSSRKTSRAEIESGRRAVSEARLAAGGDVDRAIDTAALGALFGDAAASFDPLGLPGEEARIDRSSVERFWADHFGPTRALLVAIGDLDESTLHQTVNRAFRRLPAARTARTERGLPEGQRRGTAIVAHEAAAGVAVAFPDFADAAALALRLGETLPSSSTHGSVELSIDAFEVRGGALLVARGRSRTDPIDLAEELAMEVERSRREPIARRAASGAEDEVRGWSEGVGSRWIARSSKKGGPSRGIGVAVLVAGGRGDRLRDAEPDAATLAAATQRTEAMLDRIASEVEPSLRGRLEADHASIALENGARIEAMRLPGAARVGLVVRLAGGASEDPPSLHGRAALLAALYERRCNDSIASHQSVHVTTRVEASAVEIAFDVEAARAREGIDQALACWLHASYEPSAIEDARLALLERLGTPDAPERASSWAASLLAPKSPGLIAPLGRAGTIANVRVSDVVRADRELRGGGRITVGLAGDVDLREAVLRIARRIARLPRGTPVPPPHLAAAPRSVDSVSFAGPLPRVVVTYRALFDARATALGAEALAAVLARVLIERIDAHVVFAHGGADSWGAWAAVGFDLDEASLDSLPDTLRAARPELRERIATELADRLRERRWARADSSGLARALAEEEPAPEPRLVETARRLSETTPSFVIGRPRRRSTEGVAPRR